MSEVVQVLKVKYEGTTLILRREMRDVMWDYFEDWNYNGIEIELTTMPAAEVDALPELECFP